MEIRRQLKLYYLKIVRLRETPEDIARGMALGLFIGMTPTMGFQMPIALAASTIFKENKIASVLGVWITNPLTAPAIYFFNYKVGAFVMGKEVTFPASAGLEALVSMGADILLPLWLGGFVVGVIVGAFGYFSTLRAVRVYRGKRELIKKKLREEKELIAAKLLHEKEVILKKVHEDSQKISDFLHHKSHSEPEKDSHSQESKDTPESEHHKEH